MENISLAKEIAERIYKDIKPLSNFDQYLIVNILAQKISIIQAKNDEELLIQLRNRLRLIFGYLANSKKK